MAGSSLVIRRAAFLARRLENGRKVKVKDARIHDFALRIRPVEDSLGEERAVSPIHFLLKDSGGFDPRVTPRKDDLADAGAKSDAAKSVAAKSDTVAWREKTPYAILGNSEFYGFTQFPPLRRAHGGMGYFLLDFAKSPLY